jgi:hypothetical protein
MFRNDNTPGSAFVDMIVSAGSGVSFQWRSAANGGCNAAVIGGVAAPKWVELVRSGNTFTGYYSGDAMTWTQAGSATVTLATTALAGLAVTAHNNSALCLAALDFAATAPPLPPTGPSATANYTQVALSWNPSTTAASYNLKRALAAAGPYTNLINLSTTTFADTNVANGKTYYYKVSAVNPLGESADSGAVSASIPLPALTAVLTNNFLTLSWPVTATSFSLVSLTNLTPPITWTAVTNTRISRNGQLTVTLPPSGTARFYWLR